jgi:hypothetical protein
MEWWCLKVLMVLKGADGLVVLKGADGAKRC